METVMGIFKKSVLALMILLVASCNAGTVDTPAVRERPQAFHLGPLSPDLMGITVRQGRVEYGEQIPYSKDKGGDVKVDESNNAWIRSWGKVVGALVCNGARIMTMDRLVGEKLNTESADRPENWVVTSGDDPEYAGGASPVSVSRKSKPTNLARLGADFDAPMEHTLYLKLTRPLKIGKRYTVTSKDDGLAPQSFVYDPAYMRSEAVHVSHVGFRPDDPSKAAFLSCWLGSGGPMDFGTRKRFRVLIDKTGATAYEGEVKLSKAASDKNEDAYNRNFNGTDVYMMDFSPLKEPGQYRVYVDGVGCSYPFVIGEDVWRKAFYVSVRGLYHERSGIALGPPYTSFTRPRNFHPDDGVKVYASNASLMDTANGLAEDGDQFAKLVLGKTAEIVPNAWGGYCDAGDWDRRIQHLEIARLLLDLAGLFPSFFEKMDLNIPKGNDGLPDIMNEALWGIDFFKRMQLTNGAIRGGIESGGHPKYGEASWQETWSVMAYAPDPWSTYLYAAAAARAAHALTKRSPALAAGYAESARNAMNWAERELKNGTRASYPYPVKDARNLAAAELFRLTGQKDWHDLFLLTTAFKSAEAPLVTHNSYDQGEAAWVYYNTDRTGADAAVKRNCKNAILAEARSRIFSQARAGFKWGKSTWRPPFGGAFSVPDCIPVVRAHIITGEKEYLQAVVLAAQTGLGANPLNMTYTSGVGYKYPEHVMHMDSRVTRQPPPPGLTVEGPLDTEALGGWQTPIHMYAGKFCYPSPRDWPVIETYWDVFWYPMMCEFTVWQTIAPTAFVWGYLAARK